MFAQVTSKQLGTRVFQKENNTWYVLDNVTSTKFKVHETSMTVRLKENVSKDELLKLNKFFGVKIELENKLQFIDLVLPKDSKFYTIYEEYEKSGLFESIDVNSFGIQHKNITNDVYDNQQYYLYNSPESGYPYYPYINAEDAWDFENGSTNPVVVAVIGNGVDKNHVDLSMGQGAQLGWDFYDNDWNPSPSTGSHPDYNHETLVAGIIAAKTNNNTGVAGIAGGWGNESGAKIMALRIGEKNMYQTGKLDDALIYAADNGAKIISMSFGIDETAAAVFAINYAKDKGCLLIASSGNNHKNNNVKFPARNSNVIAVSGVLPNGNWYGDYGPEIELSAAAGQGIYSTKRANEYGTFTGTSAAVPQVAGVSALLWSYNPNFISIDVINILRASAKDLGAPGKDIHFGYGLVQALDAVHFANPINELMIQPPQNVTLTGAYNTHPVIHWNTVTSGNINKYCIYRADKINGNYHYFNKLAEVTDNGSNDYSWTDNSVTRINPRFATSTHYYRVTSVDNNSVESVTSNEVSTTSNWMEKQGSEKDNKEKYNYSLSKNYPNPFNPSTQIEYSLKEKGFVSLTVYNVLGSKVTELVNQNKSEGKHTVKLNSNGKNLSSGIYFYTLKVNDYIATKKMLLTK